MMAGWEEFETRVRERGQECEESGEEKSSARVYHHPFPNENGDR